MFKFQTPEGVKDELFNEYERKQRIVKDINDIFRNFGYREAFTPTIEYYDVFSSIKSTVLKGEMFKLIDKSGDILVLRPDVTIPIARMVANNSKTSKRNFKVYYNHQVFRMDNENRREMTQTGIEYFGNGRLDSDAEVISIAAKSLLKVDIDFRIEIGHANYYKGLLEETDIEEEVYVRLKELIENKNFVELQRLAEELDLDERVKNAIVEMPNLYGDYQDVLEQAKSLCLNEKMNKALEDLKEVCQIINDFGYGEFISVDLGLINHLDYYTGVIFKGYMSSHGEMILSGGRYDDLTENYGESIPATGFAINVDELISGIEKQVREKEIIDDYIDYRVIYKSKDRKTAFRLMENLRSKNFIVEGESFTETLEEIILEDRDAKNIIIMDDKYIELMDKKNDTKTNIKLDEFTRIL